MTEYDEFDRDDADYRESRRNIDEYDQNFSRASQANIYRGGRSQDYDDRYVYARRERFTEVERDRSPRRVQQAQDVGLSDNAKINLLIGGCVGIVLIALILCITLQRCDGCGAKQDIPVVEQGDTTVQPSDTDIYDIMQPVSEGDADVSGSDAAFTVTVSHADGTYTRTGAQAEDAAQLVISQQNETGFSFALTVSGSTLNGAAYFISENTAMCEAIGAQINFRFGQGEVFVEESAPVSGFGDRSCSGVYSIGAQTTTNETGETTQTTKAPESAAANNYDANIKDSDTVKAALNSLLPASDLTLMNNIFADGTSAVQQGAAGQGKDKNGKDINIDRELDAVKYYVFVAYSGEELVLICKNDGKVYLGLCDGGEYRYYTNDSAYKSKAPQAIIGQADVKGMKLIYK